MLQKIKITPTSQKDNVVYFWWLLLFTLITKHFYLPTWLFYVAKVFKSHTNAAIKCCGGTNMTTKQGLAFCWQKTAKS